MGSPNGEPLGLHHYHGWNKVKEMRQWQMFPQHLSLLTFPRSHQYHDQKISERLELSLLICSPHTIVLSGPTTPLKQSLLESRMTSIITKSNGHFSVFRWSQSRFFFLRGRLQCLLSLLNHVLPRSSLTYLPYFSLSFISLQAHSRIHRHETLEYLKVQS